MKEVFYLLRTKKWKEATSAYYPFIIEATRRRRYAAFLLYVQKDVIIYFFPHYCILSNSSLIFLASLFHL